MNDKEGTVLTVGFFIVIVIVKIMKRYLRHPRPSTGLQKTFGMPSTRAATIFFVITYLMLIIKRIQHKTILIMLVIAFTACVMKYVMREHTILQLVVGAIIGIIGGFIANYISAKKLKKYR